MHSESSVELRKKIEEPTRYKPDSEENLINLTQFSILNSEYKHLNKCLSFILTPEVCNKNELGNDF